MLQPHQTLLTRHNRCIAMGMRRLCIPHRPIVDLQQSLTTLPGVKTHILRSGRRNLPTTLCPVMLPQPLHSIIPLNPIKTRRSTSSPSPHTNHLRSCDGTLNTSLVHLQVHQTHIRLNMCNHRHIRLLPQPDPWLISSPAGRRLSPTITSRSSPVQDPHTRRCRPANRGRTRRPSRSPRPRIKNPHGRWRRA
jgi:hypothetical protein